MADMRRSTKLGIASALLLGSTLVPAPYFDLRGPISFASVWLSCVLGLLAAQQGSKWWLVIPGAIIAGGSAIFYFASTAY